jgi:hypothetical protein
MPDLENHRSVRRARHPGYSEVTLLRRELAFARRTLCELSNRVESLPRYRLSFRLELVLAEALERFLRRFPDRIYNSYGERHDDYRVRLGRPYRRRERREREALLRRSPTAITAYEISEMCDEALRGPLDIDAELARIRGELDAEFA